MLDNAIYDAVYRHKLSPEIRAMVRAAYKRGHSDGFKKGNTYTRKNLAYTTGVCHRAVSALEHQLIVLSDYLCAHGKWLDAEADKTNKKINSERASERRGIK